MSKIKTLAIDIGHNVSYDRGAVGIRKEDELNKLVGDALISKCKVAGLNVVNCTPNSAGSLYDSLNQRCITANRAAADLFISIHHNACPGGYGSEVLLIKGGVNQSLKEQLSREILTQLNTLGLANRGIKDRRNLFVLNQTSMPAIVIECAFCDSNKDMSNYSPGNVAAAIFKALCNVLEISPGNSSSNGSTSSKVHIVQSGETLWGISQKYGTTVDRLVEINGITNRNLINVGQKLIIK